MATLLLSAAGAALGGSMGGSIAGLTMGAMGKAVGATVGAMIDHRLTGAGSAPVETGRVERFRVMGAGEGSALPRAFGRVRLAGQVIWASRFLENVSTSEIGGKGGGGGQEVREFRYSISLALALCEGEVARVGRIWADGQVMDLVGQTWRLHEGSETQIVDPLISAIEGEQNAPAYRGTAYVVFENLDLTPFGNRIPQFNFEVVRRSEGLQAEGLPHPAGLLRGVALVPGTGEYGLATTPVHFNHGKGRSIVANVNNDRGRPDLEVSLEQLRAEAPGAKAVSLVVSWFGDDLRCSACSLQPAVEQAEQDGDPMPWRVSGVGRFSAKQVGRLDGRPVFGGTPADAAVVEAIRHMTSKGHAVVFYPFILMDIAKDSTLQNPWNDGFQPAVPWRGRITLSTAPGRVGTTDQSPAAALEVEAFFGSAQLKHFSIENGEVAYSGPAEWSYRRFILHYAFLCAQAGGVDAFCIGSEMRSLTQVRKARDQYPAVEALRTLAADVRSILGPEVRLGYAADWSEYFGHQPNDGSNDVIFHLDPLWGDDNIDFVGIDNYMPLSDWRDEPGHADSIWGSITNLEYLLSNVAGGEGYDWYYASTTQRSQQERRPIVDAEHGEHWIFRYKDIRNWWHSAHHNRIAGVRQAKPTAWRPGSKPVWFTELGCPAIDKGTNQPNVFHDPKSSESFFPHFSTGACDEFIQHRYFQTIFSYWNNPQNNPKAEIYDGRMVDMDRAFVWAWDARPWPDFPARLETWVDGLNFERGHWINGRLSLPTLAETIGQICDRASPGARSLVSVDGLLTGYTISSVETSRQSLQPLMLVYGVDCFSSDGTLSFVSRGGRVSATIASEALAVARDGTRIRRLRSAPGEIAGRVTLGFIRHDMDYQPAVADAAAPEVHEPDTSQSSLPVVLSVATAGAVAARWLSEGRIASNVVEFTLPPSGLALTPGDVISITGEGPTLYRVDRIEDFGQRSVTAVRIEPSLYEAPIHSFPLEAVRTAPAPAPAYVEFLDLPLLTGDESPHSPYIVVTRTPWAGPVSIWSSSSDFSYSLSGGCRRPATLGRTLDALAKSTAGLWSRQNCRIRLDSGALLSADVPSVLNGENTAAVRQPGEGEWEVIQFRSAELVGPDEYVLRDILRGQAGTDGVSPLEWPAGCDFVLINQAAEQIALPLSSRGLERHYRIGPSNRSYSHPSYLYRKAAFAGVGLRPYRPAHLRATRDPDGTILLRWFRRSRIDGDGWHPVDIPIGEEREAYRVVISVDGVALREKVVSAPEAWYSLEEQADDRHPLEVDFAVSQISERWGTGPAISTKYVT